jgi:predicted alpha-1,2-mannosidase
MRKNAEQESSESDRSGRIGQAEYAEHGYLKEGARNCVSRSIEYANQDAATARLARHLNLEDLADQFEASSKRVWACWQESKQSLCPQRSDGQWVEPYNPALPTRKDYWNCPYFYEGSGYEWTLNLRHDLPGLIERLGGPESFEAYLDTFFEKHIILWKEILHHTPYLYHHIGKPGKSCLAARKLLRERYHSGRDGLPDNEDMGSNSAFVMCTMIGLYPEMGEDYYYLIPPLFNEMTLSVGKSNTLVIRAENAGDEMVYLAKANLNGQELDTAWLRHSDLAKGGMLELTLSKEPTDFGKEPPPSRKI